MIDNKYYVNDCIWCREREQFRHSLVCLLVCEECPYCSDSWNYEAALPCKIREIAMKRIGIQLTLSSLNGRKD